MRPSLDYVKLKFEEFNLLCFDGSLPPIPLRLSNARSSLGQFVHPARYPANLPRGKGECYLRISVRFDLPEKEVEDTIIHEMIHYYIWYHRLKDTSAHGPVFRRIMEDINRRHGRNLSVSHRLQEEERQSDRHNRSNYIVVTRWQDGKLGITICAKTRLFDIHRALASHPQVIGMLWFWSRSPWFNRFPVSRSVKVYGLTEEEFAREFANATPCECDGKEFRPKKKK